MEVGAVASLVVRFVFFFVAFFFVEMVAFFVVEAASLSAICPGTHFELALLVPVIAAGLLLFVAGQAFVKVS